MEYRRKLITRGVDRCMHFFDKRREILGCVNRPIDGEKVIVDNVHDDCAETPQRWFESIDAAPRDGMRIRERINQPMLRDAALEGRRQRLQFRRASEIGKQIADAKARIGGGEVKVGQPIHGKAAMKITARPNTVRTPFPNRK